ncbi:hypothetical protein [Bradyrhizobium sp. UFLA05-112]
MAQIAVTAGSTGLLSPGSIALSVNPITFAVAAPKPPIVPVGDQYSQS